MAVEISTNNKIHWLHLSKISMQVHAKTCEFTDSFCFADSIVRICFSPEECEECASSIAAAEAPGPGLNSGVSRQSSSAVAPLKNHGLRSTELFFFFSFLL